MNKVIGVGDERALPQLKRWLLLVDQIAVVDEYENDWSFRSKKPSLAAELDWLTERGIVFSVNNHSNLTINVKEVRQEGDKVVLIRQPGLASIYIQPHARANGKPMTVSQLIDAIHETICRLECEILRRGSVEIDAISLRTRSPRSLIYGIEPAALGDVQHVVINAMPEPDESTPLDRILEFRNDPVVMSKLRALRRWMAKMTKANVSPRELADEVQWLLDEYETYMKVHEMKIRRGVLETLITGTAEMLENLVKIKWGQLATMPFAISARKIDLLEAELKAPGREISYVAHVRSELR